MKQIKYYALALLSLVFFTVSGQDSEAVTDEELKNYAVLMDSIVDMRQSLLFDMSESIKNNDQITASRYNDLSKIIEDSVKLKAVSATEAEIAAIKKVISDRDKGAAQIQETFKVLVKDLLGAASYNKVKKALKSDAELKRKYDALLDQINKAEDGD
jgi:hypothetical protein